MVDAAEIVQSAKHLGALIPVIGFEMAEENRDDVVVSDELHAQIAVVCEKTEKVQAVKVMAELVEPVHNVIMVFDLNQLILLVCGVEEQHRPK